MGTAQIVVPVPKTDPIRRIAPVAPSPSLLTSARRLPDGLDWMQGLSWTPVCQPSFAEPFCPPDVFETDSRADKETSNDRVSAHTKPFVIYTPMACNTNTIDLSDQEPIVVDLTEIHTATALAAALWMGTGLPDSSDTDPYIPTLRRVGVDAGHGQVYDLDDGVALLLSAYESCTGGNGGAMIHMPSILAPFALGGGAGGARVCWPEGTVYRGALNSTIVPGPGYPNGSSEQGADGHGPMLDFGPPQEFAGNDDDTLWMYVSGPVEYDVTPVVAWPADEQDRRVFRQNRYEVWGERSAIVRFDPCCVYAVEVANPVPAAEVLS